MRNKIISLVLGLLVILAAPALIQSCNHSAENSPQTAVTAAIHTLECEAPANEYIQTYAVNSQTSAIAESQYLMTAVQDADPGGTVEPTDDSGLNTWAIVVSAVISIVALFFGAQWKKTLGVLDAIRDSVKAGSPGGEKVTVEEIKQIIKAFKGI